MKLRTAAVLLALPAGGAAAPGDPSLRGLQSSSKEPSTSSKEPSSVHGVPISTYNAANILDDNCATEFVHHYDSADASDAFHRMTHPGATSLQLNLGKTVLRGDAKVILSGSHVGGSLEIGADALARGNGWSDALDGDRVDVTLKGDTGGAASRLIVTGYVAGGVCDEHGGQSICGVEDDRVLSQDVRQGRLSMGCTGWLISEDIMVTAGHCEPSSGTRIHFDINHAYPAPVEDQYAVDMSSYQGVNGGSGNDWGVGRLLPNASTGLKAGVAQSAKCDGDECAWYQLGGVPAQAAGNSIRITGYGSAAVQNQWQKTHVGALTHIGDTYLRYVPDTTGGNSGSPVLHEETGEAIGVHTHGGCSATGGSNLGTRIDQADFAAKIQMMIDSEPASVAPTRSPIPCDVGGTLKVEITTDNYPGETTWALKDLCDGFQVFGGGPYTQTGTTHEHEICVSPSEFEFTIVDSYGDGICCTYGTGGYTVFLDGILEIEGGDFGTSETKDFGICNPPTSPPISPPTSPPISPPTSPPISPPTSPPISPPTSPPISPPTSPPISPPTSPPAPTPPVGGDPGPADPTAIHIDLSITMRFTFTSQSWPACVGDVAGRASGSSLHECARACASLATCAGFDALDDASNGACVLSMGGSSECDLATAANAVHYERTAVQHFG